MDQTPQILLTLGCILLLGMATDVLGQRTFLPRVTLMRLFGILIGPDQNDSDILSSTCDKRFTAITSSPFSVRFGLFAAGIIA